MKHPELPPSRPLGFAPEQFGPVLQQDDLMRALTDVEKEHPYWEQFRHKVKDFGADPGLLWHLVKFLRRGTMKNLVVSGVETFRFQYRVTDETLRRLHEFDLNLGGILESGSLIPSEDKNRYLLSSIMEEAIASSQLEGAVTTREEAKEMLRTQRKPRNHSEKMILNNYLTMRKILETKHRKMTPDLLLDIHATITKDTLDDPAKEGQFRQNDEVRVEDVTTGEVFYLPPPQKHLAQLIQDFCAFANEEAGSEFIHPIIRATILHFLIGYIHPFADGNGRTARAVFYWYLIAKGYWLIEFMSISRIILKSNVQYAKAYLHTELDDNDLTYFINYQLKSLDMAFKSLREYIARKMREKRELFELVKTEGINERQTELLRKMMTDGQKTLTIREAEHLFNVVYQTARTDLLDLANRGFLEAKTVGKKLVFYRSATFEQQVTKLR